MPRAFVERKQGEYLGVLGVEGLSITMSVGLVSSSVTFSICSRRGVKVRLSCGRYGRYGRNEDIGRRLGLRVPSIELR